MGHPDKISGTRAQSETEIVKLICDYLHGRAFFFWRSNNIPVFGRALPKYTPRGLPDIFVLKDRMFIAIEVKRPKGTNEREPNGRKVRSGKLSPYQAEFGAKISIHGGIYIVAHSLEEFIWSLEEATVRRNASLVPKSREWREDMK